MRASYFDNVPVFFFEFAEGLNQSACGGNQLIFDRKNKGDVHCRRERVVRRLAHVHVVVRVEDVFPGESVRAVCDNFVHVHIRLCAASRLPHDKRKFGGQLSAANFIAYAFYTAQFFGIHFVRKKLCVCPRGRLFQHAEGMDYFGRHRFDSRSDFKILPAAFGLRAPIRVFRD